MWQEVSLTKSVEPAHENKPQCKIQCNKFVLYDLQKNDSILIPRLSQDCVF